MHTHVDREVGFVYYINHSCYEGFLHYCTTLATDIAVSYTCVGLPWSYILLVIPETEVRGI